MTAGQSKRDKMTGASLEVAGKAAVQQKAGPASSVEIAGKAAVDSDVNDRPSLQIIGKAAVQNDRGSVEIIGEATVQNDTGVTSLAIIRKGGVEGSEGRYSRIHLIHCSWTKACLAGTGITCWGVILFVRFIYIWQQCLMASGESAWSVMKASVVLGMELGLFVMAGLLVLLIPKMIITWTTAVVFEYMLGVLVSGKIRRQQVVEDGTKVAKEISWMTLTRVLEEGNAVAAAVLVVCFATTAFLRQNLLTVG